MSLSEFLIMHADLDQPPRFILEPQDAVLPTRRGNDLFNASIHCSHNSSNTTVTWYRNGAPLTYTDTRILYDNGTVEFRPLLAPIDVTTDGVEYHCVLSNASGSVISRTAVLQLASKSTLCYALSYVHSYFIEPCAHAETLACLCL